MAIFFIAPATAVQGLRVVHNQRLMHDMLTQQINLIPSAPIPTPPQPPLRSSNIRPLLCLIFEHCFKQFLMGNCRIQPTLSSLTKDCHNPNKTPNPDVRKQDLNSVQQLCASVGCSPQLRRNAVLFTAPFPEILHLFNHNLKYI